MNPQLIDADRRILIVDDNPAIHQDFRKILCPVTEERAMLQDLKAAIFNREPTATKETQFELVSAFQGQEALEKVKQGVADNRPFAMAFLDVRMPPGWDGIETAMHLWEACPQLQIVICTAYSDYSWDDMRSRLDKPDSLVILKKPFDNVEVQQLAHAMTRKWLVTKQSELKHAELEQMVVERTRRLQETYVSLGLSEERFSKAFHGSPMPCAIQSLTEQRFVDVNQRFLDILGCQRDEIIGHTAAEIFLWEKPEMADQWVEDLMREKSVRDREARIRRKDGALNEVLVSFSILAVNKEPHMLLLAQDVTARVLLERQLRQAQKMEAVGQLAAGVAHDFNNILTVIQGHSGIMQQSIPTDCPTKKSLDAICKATNRAASLIQQLLMFSRKQVMQFKYLDLNVLLDGTIKMLERLVGERVKIQFTSADSLPAIKADTSMIEQIVMNLAVNARDAMPDGGIIGISTAVETIHRAPIPLDPESRDGEFVCLTFSDNGVGMDAAVKTRIFEPFFTTKPVGKGTGLGLSTVFGIVRQHRGWLVVMSEPNQGTTFKLYFPPTNEAPESTEAPPENMFLRGAETVLVAEDEEPLREMVAQVLRIQGYTVFVAESAAQALEIWERAKYAVDLLLTDMVMPGTMSGADLADQMQARSPNLKVIYTSGYSPGMAGRDTSLLETRNFLLKPYSIGKLACLIRQCLDGRGKKIDRFPARGNGPPRISLRFKATSRLGRKGTARTVILALSSSSCSSHPSVQF